MDKDKKTAYRSAIYNEYLTTKEELQLYYNAIYEAMQWGRKIDKENIKKKNDKGIFINHRTKGN